jgi:cell division protein FtsN
MLAVYRDKLDAWTSYMQQNYPHLLQPENKGSAQRQMVDASMDAFEALERQLQQQQEEQQRQRQRQRQQQQKQEQLQQQQGQLQEQQQQQPGQQMDVD